MPVRCIRDGKPRAVLLAAALCGIAVVLTVAYRATASRVHGAVSEPLAPNSAGGDAAPTPRRRRPPRRAAAEPPAPTPRPVGSSGSARTFVDVAGSDAGAGTASRPFATARAARASRVARRRRASSEIAFGAGIHYVSEPIALGAGDGGTTLRGDDGAWLSGGLPINATCWQLVLYKHPVYSAIWAAQTTDIEGDKAELHAQSSTQLTFLWKCDLRAALGGPPATVDMLRVVQSAIVRANLTFVQGGMSTSHGARASSGTSLVTSFVVGNWDPALEGADIRRIATFSLECGSGRDCDADERAAFAGLVEKAELDSETELRFYVEDLRALSEEEWWYEADLETLFVWPTYSLTTHATRAFTGMTWQSDVVVPIIRAPVVVDGASDVEIRGLASRTRRPPRRGLAGVAVRGRRRRDASVHVRSGARVSVAGCRFDLLAGAGVRVHAAAEDVAVSDSTFVLAKQPVATLEGSLGAAPTLPCLSRQDALDAGGFFDDVGPCVMAATRLPYGDDEVCAAACDATRLWRATQSTGAVVGLASC
ncbi:hypothetical protein JL722_2537 [Aureococcus anophagefferens]|nr:hypothetical protein JL722_2537 [Aureococcus anophagefferens]